MNSLNQPTIVSMEPTDVSEVAEQFVLCYYKMMHEHPDQLHRFYQGNSSMIYEDSPVFGQKNIHDKFMQLNLSNNSGVKVHVLQLDALKAHDKIVIQVAGEISANECEWRRFMQTFVLGEVSCNNFFVMTDIFRFQDRIFSDRSQPEAQAKPLSTPLHSNYLLNQNEIKNNVEKPQNNYPKESTTKNFKQAASNGQQNGVELPHLEPQIMPLGHISMAPQAPVVASPVQESKPVPQSYPLQAQQPIAPSPIKDTANSLEPPAAKSWAQMASNGVNTKSRPTEHLSVTHSQMREQQSEQNEIPHFNQRGSERVNSGRGSRYAKSGAQGDRDNQESRGDKEGHVGPRSGHMRGSGHRNTNRGAIAVGGSRRN